MDTAPYPLLIMGDASRSSGCSFVQVGSAAFLLALTTLSALALLAYQLSASTKWGREEFWGDMTNDLTLDSNTLQHVPRGYYVEGFSSLTIVWWWGVPLGATLFSIALLQLPGRSVVFERAKGVTAFLAREVGVSDWALSRTAISRRAGVQSFTVGEFLVIVVFVLVNLFEGHRVYYKFPEGFHLYEDDEFVPPPEWAKKWNAFNFSLGYMSFVNFAIIFFPVARNSPLFDLMGLSFETRIKYHRWLSHYCMWIVTAHGLLYWVFWLVRGEFLKSAINRGYQVDSVAGAISIFFGWALWITSLEFFRRKFFEVFYRLHIVCFLGFALFANLHVPGYTAYLPAGLLLYAVDVVLRVVQQSAPVEVEAAVNSDGTIAGLYVQTVKGFSTRGTPVVWISCPSISSCQWHPVTPIVSSDGNLTIYFKLYGKWTKELCDKIRTGKLAHLHIEGPHDVGSEGLASEFMEYSSLFFFSGGIAITPVLAILEAINSCDMNLEQNKPSIFVYWTVRGVAELEAGLPLLRKFMRKHPGLLVLEVYVTGKNKTVKKLEPLPLKDEERCFFQQLRSILRRYIGRAPAPVLVPAKQGPLHLTILYIVAYGGGLAGLILGRAWRLEHMQAGEPHRLGNNNAVQFTMTIAMAIGLTTLFVLPLHIWKTIKASQEFREQKEQKNPSQQANVPVVSDLKDGEIYEQRHTGRPDFNRIIQTLKTGGADKNSTVVIAGGPTPLVAAVRKASQAANFKFHEATFEL